MNHLDTNDLELVRDLYEDFSVVTDARLAAGRDRLLASITESSGSRYRQRRAPRGWPLRRLALTGAAVAAAAVAVVAIQEPSRSSTRAPGPRMTLAAQVLRAAALTVASQPSTRPAPGQWIYSKSVDFVVGQPVQVGEEWMQFDGHQDAYLWHGQLIVHSHPTAPPGAGNALDRYLEQMTPMSAYNALSSLPSSPRALLSAVDATVATHAGSVASPGSSPTPGRSRAHLEFEFLTQLLWNASQAAPAKAEANVFRAIATIPGVSAQRGITDAVGRPAIGMSYAGDTEQLLLDPRTYQVTGLRTISNGKWPVNPDLQHGPNYPKGKVIDSSAWARIEFVAGPGRR